MNLALSESELPVRLRFERPLTDIELMRFCTENDILRVEREPNGELIVMSPTGFEGGLSETEVATELALWARQEGRGKCVGSNGGFTLPDSSVRAADAAWISLNRLNALTPEQRKGYAPTCPEFVIEVRSQSDRLAPLQAKMEQWIANGVELAWLIDPMEKTVTVYRPGEQPEIHEDPTSIQGTGPVSGFELVLARIWA
jgi:Uma2 family endonuclease